MADRNRRFACLFFLIAWAGCSCARPAETNSAMNGGLVDSRHLTLTPRNRTAEHELPQDLASLEKYKFVQIVVVSVENPNQHAVTFDVHHITPKNEKIFLGTFSLFPADNPGRFIVPTQGKLKPRGRLTLSLVLPPDVRDTDPLKVTTKEMTLRED